MADDPWDELGMRGRSLALSTGRRPRFHPGLTFMYPGLSVGMRQQTGFDGPDSHANRGSRLHPGLGIQARAVRVVDCVRTYVFVCACESPRTRARTGERRTSHLVCWRISPIRPHGIAVGPGLSRGVFWLNGCANSHALSVGSMRLRLRSF